MRERIVERILEQGEREKDDDNQKEQKTPSRHSLSQSSLVFAILTTLAKETPSYGEAPRI